MRSKAKNSISYRIVSLSREHLPPPCSISDTGDCYGYCRFPAFLWQRQQQQHQQPAAAAAAPGSGWFESAARPRDAAAAVSERRWLERTVDGGSESTWESRREIAARPSEIWTERCVRTPCGGGGGGDEDPPPRRRRRRHGRTACYRRESASNVTCLAEEPSGKYRVLVGDADG